ncbi:MAG: hypothetical protein RIQ78_456 [Bacteroidota bacterium]|jgi:DNA-3-methyladenine glycosylase II
MNLDEAIRHLRKDPNIGQLLDAVAVIDFSPTQTIYIDLLKSIISQQLNVKVAAVIQHRFLLLFPDQNPHPGLIMSLDRETLRSVGLSNQKAQYICNVAQFASLNDFDTIDWHKMSDDDIIQFLCQIKGVGKWTVQMLLMFSLGRPDVFPLDDLGIQQGMIKLFELKETGKQLKNKMIELAEPWSPWRSVAARCVWRWKDTA